MKKIIVLNLAAAALLCGCKPYNVPEYKEVKASETAFVVPLEDDAKNQSKFDSKAFLDSHMVFEKRILIPKREVQVGRMWWDVEYIPVVRVLSVDRSPVTVKWVSEHSGQGNGIWVESSDSIGFSTGFSVSAYVKENEAALFLYNYSGGSLEKTLDTEVRARVQRIVAQVAAKYNIDDLRSKKNEILGEIEKDVVSFFEKKGITITTIGQFGGFTYENNDIQTAIDKTFIAQQEKVVAAAALAAQGDKNKRVESEAIGLAEAAKTKAGGEAEGKLLIYKAEAQGKKLTAEAEASGISSVNKALADANGNPQLIELRRVEVELEKARRWNGSVPSWVWGDKASNGMILNIDPSRGSLQNPR